MSSTSKIIIHVQNNIIQNYNLKKMFGNVFKKRVK